MSAIFGGSKQQQTSSNQSTQQSSSGSENRAYDYLVNAFGGGTPATNEAFGNINDLLEGNTAGFEQYKKAGGFNALLEQGSRGITGNAAASGLLRSGGTAKSLQDYGQTMAGKYLGDYLGTLFNKGQMGLSAGNLISGAGNKSESSSFGQSTGIGQSSGSSKNGMGGFLGSVLGGVAASDRRLKTDIEPIYTMPDGLGIYRFRYIGEDQMRIGAMADEVATLRPEALGPVIQGYATVNYDKIWE